MTVGKRLRAAREAHGMSIGDIARRTYIQPKFIEAIEEDNIAFVPDSHRRLFVREYAKMVGIPQDEVLRLLDESAPPPPPLPIAETAAPVVRSFSDEAPSAPAPRIQPLSDRERKTYGDFMRRLSRGGGIKLGTNKLSRWLILSAIVLLVVVAGYYMIFGGKDTPQASGVPAADTTDASPTQILSRGSGEGDTATRPDTATALASGDSLTLEGRASSKIWFAIVMDGKRSETGTMDSGSVKVWRASKNFKLSLGNAGGLQLTLNDKKLGVLGPMRTSIRNQIIDATGVRKVLRSPSSTTTRRPARQQQPRTPRIITPTEMRTAPPR